MAEPAQPKPELVRKKYVKPEFRINVGANAQTWAKMKAVAALEDITIVEAVDRALSEYANSRLRAHFGDEFGKKS